ncbi:hypothetical protein ASD8599_03101 [Ascidiaceihabitans donghaensis]|uniref:Methanolan biosynthesis EpsI domain-containing protein n=1 Tax=Ascidiaceihabitans donghaensis TaxID=1510460 RepID=A0A2R8BH10_9RHOB|nr:hypothetical protein [Ascidiaceihabitans donghaensis]SPH22358.1 hypothetical protein ASD8599_03101 [Ascidiaceihabitans donghaensis]
MFSKWAWVAALCICTLPNNVMSDSNAPTSDPAYIPYSRLPEDFCDHLFDLKENVWGSKAPVNQFLRMEMEGKTLPIKLPRNYLEEGWDFNEGYTVPSHGFRVDMDNFAPIHSRDLRAFWDKRGQRHLSIVVADTTDLPQILQSLTRNRFPKPELHGGLTRNYIANLDLVRTEPARPVVMHSIMYSGYDASNTVTDVFRCSREGYGVNQTCSHYFRAHAVDVNTRFNGSHLSEWKTIKANVTQFLGCMLISEGKFK